MQRQIAEGLSVVSRGSLTRRQFNQHKHISQQVAEFSVRPGRSRSFKAPVESPCHFRTGSGSTPACPKSSGDEGGDNEQWKTAMIGSIHRSEEHTSELQSLMRNSYAVFCLKKKKRK